jgi:hypothetical protein
MFETVTFRHGFECLSSFQLQQASNRRKAEHGLHNRNLKSYRRKLPLVAFVLFASLDPTTNNTHIMSRSPIRAQQQDRREAAKRHIMGAWMDESKNSASLPDDSAFDGSNNGQVQLLIEDLQSTFEKHVELMKTDLLSAKNEQVQVHRMAIVKLPKPARQMTIREFNQAHNCNLLSMLKGADGVISQEGGKKRDHAAVAATPAPRVRNEQCPGSAFRTVRRGEKV